jgi:hypothetical protein
MNFRAKLFLICFSLISISASTHAISFTFPKGIDVKKASELENFEFSISNEGVPAMYGKHLSKEERKGGGYVGLGAEQNYQYIFESKADEAWLYDYSTPNVLTHALYKVAFHNSKNPKELLEFFNKNNKMGIDAEAAILRAYPNRLEANALVTHYKRLTSQLSKEKNFPGKNTYHGEIIKRFLSKDSIEFTTIYDDQERFDYIKKLYEEDKIHYMVGDHNSKETYQGIAKEAKSSKIKIKNIYLSNAHEEVYKPANLVKNLGDLPLDEKAEVLISRSPWNLTNVGAAVNYFSQEELGKLPKTDCHFPGALKHGTFKWIWGPWEFYTVPVKSFQKGYKILSEEWGAVQDVEKIIELARKINA